LNKVKKVQKRSKKLDENHEIRHSDPTGVEDPVNDANQWKFRL
jgi:hypothetical protein